MRAIYVKLGNSYVINFKLLYCHGEFFLVHTYYEY